MYFCVTLLSCCCSLAHLCKEASLSIAQLTSIFWTCCKRTYPENHASVSHQKMPYSGIYDMLLSWPLSNSEYCHIWKIWKASVRVSSISVSCSVGVHPSVFILTFVYNNINIYIYNKGNKHFAKKCLLRGNNVSFIVSVCHMLNVQLSWVMYPNMLRSPLSVLVTVVITGWTSSLLTTRWRTRPVCYIFFSSFGCLFMTRRLLNETACISYLWMSCSTHNLKQQAWQAPSMPTLHACISRAPRQLFY